MKNLERMKRMQVLNLIAGSIFSAAAILVTVLDLTGICVPLDGSITAALVGGGVGALSSYFQRRRILRDAEKTEEFLAKEYDERNVTITLHTATATVGILGYLGVIVACVFVYINKTVFLTIMWSLVAGLVIYLLCSAFYKKKY